MFIVVNDSYRWRAKDQRRDNRWETSNRGAQPAMTNKQEAGWRRK
jgi:hypothetical protein